jgi:hypothetical protein
MSLVVAIWSVPAISASATALMQARAAGDARPTWLVVLQNSLLWMVLAVLTAPVLAVTDRVPIGPGRAARSIAVHLGCSVLFALVLLSSTTVLAMIAGGEPMTPATVVDRLARGAPMLLWCVAFYWVITVIATGIGSARRAGVAQRRAAALEASLADARLAALHAQLHPHFLFNTLNSIASLVRQKRNDQALDMIGRLGGLLRESLRRDDVRLIPLADELELADRYLAIEQVRFGDRLHVTVDVADGSQLTPVPPLLLQPLLENAIRHGAAALPDGGSLSVRARLDGDDLALRVENDGPAAAGGERDGHGLGLRNTRERLEAVYGPDHEFSFASRPEGGAVVEIRLPARRGETRESQA